MRETVRHFVVASLAAWLLWNGEGRLAADGPPPAPPIPRGPVRLRIRLPAPGGRGEPLLAVGAPADGGLLFWLDDLDGTARVGYEDTGQGTIFSSAFSAKPGSVHAIDISLGSFWSLAPGSRSAAPAGLADLLWVAVDGRTVLLRKEAFSGRGRREVFGANAIGSSSARAFFGGTLVGIQSLDEMLPQREGVRPSSLLGVAGYPGPLRLRVRLPEGAGGNCEPLLVSGKTGAADFVFVRYDDPRHVRIGFDHWGTGGPISEPIEVEPGAAYEVVASLGSLFPPGAVFHPGDPERILLPGVVWVDWAGRMALAAWLPCHPSLPEEITVGANFAGGSTARPAFGGLIEGVERVRPDAIAPAAVGAVFERVPSPGPAWDGYPGPVRLRVAFPARWISGSGDPLVVAGTTGAADIVFVRYEQDGWVRFGMDHWGWQPIISEPVRVAPGSEHELVIAEGALFPPDGSNLFLRRPDLDDWKDRVRVELDGKAVVDSRRVRVLSRPGEITYGINLAGGSTAGVLFGGRVLRVERASDGPWAEGGRP